VDLGLDGKVVLVTGAGSGIGLAIARAFADEGAQVVAADLDTSALTTISAERAPFLSMVDLMSDEAIRGWVDGAVERFGGVDVLINNVGLAPFREGFLGVTDEQWKSLLELNLFAMVRCSRAAIPHMIAGGGGSIVSLASDAGRQPDPFFVDYAMSKAAVLSVSKSISMEFGARGVRSNCIAPGPTATPAMEEFLGILGADLGLTIDEAKVHFATVMRGLPLGRMNEPEDVARVALFLGSDASRQVTGSTYSVDAGSIKYV
jgi:NAD(P)-dependent dehydrogenase (short-subunit alcohol dehydrogenase family)